MNPHECNVIPTGGQQLIDEQRRLSQLHRLEILDTATETCFDDLMSLAADLCQTSLGAITFVGENDVFHKSTLGFSAPNVPRAASFCDHTIRQDEIFVVEDALADDRFRSNELIRETGIRFYAGAPVACSDGNILGAVCVLAPEPRRLSSVQKEQLKRIARQVNVLLDLRLEKIASVTLRNQLEAQQQLFQTYFEHSPVETYLKDVEGRIQLYNTAFAKRFNLKRDEWVGKTAYDLWPRKVADEVTADERRVRETGVSRTKYMVVPGNGGTTHWRSTRIPCKDVTGQHMTLCVSVDVTAEARKAQELEKTKGDLQIAISRLRELLKIDELTGLHNRRAFEERCVDALSRLRTDGIPFSVMYIDLGALTLYNRRLGPLVVDGMLRSVGRAITLDSSVSETAARMSGGIFRVLALNATPSENDRTIARIKSNISAVRWPGGALNPEIKIRVFEDRNLHASDLFSPPATPTRRHTLYSDAETLRKKHAQRINNAYTHVYERAEPAVHQGVASSLI